MYYCWPTICRTQRYNHPCRHFSCYSYNLIYTLQTDACQPGRSANRNGIMPCVPNMLLAFLYKPSNVVGPGRQSAPCMLGSGRRLGVAPCYRCSSGLSPAAYSLPQAILSSIASQGSSTGRFLAQDDDVSLSHAEVTISSMIESNRLAWSGWADGIPPSIAALSAVTCPEQPSPQLPQIYMHHQTPF
jgi:hypothetical protein